MPTLHAPLLTRERDLYAEVWSSIDAYGRHAPGEHYAPLFLDIVGDQRGTLLDAGCGSGKGGVALAAAGFDVLLCDLTDDGLDETARGLPFRQACLWHDLRPVVAHRGRWHRQTVDYVYCCFPAGTIVGGSTMPIDRLSTGQAVGDSAGDEQGVVRTYRHQFTGDLVRLSVACVPDISMTPEHPVLVSKLRRVHRARSLNEYVASEDVWKRAADVVPGDWVSVPRLTGASDVAIRFESGRSHKVIERRIDEGLAWLLGAYVAEGSTHYGKGKRLGVGGMVFSLSSSESGFAERIISELGRLGVHGQVSQPASVKAGNSLRVIASSLGLCRVLDEWCGKYAQNKVVPEGIKRAPEPIIRAFIDGLVEGDGCVRRDSRSSLEYSSVTTVSKRLAYGLLELLHKIGVHARVSNPVPGATHIQGRAVSTLPYYVIAWQKRSWDGGKILDSAGRSPYGRGRFLNGRVYLEVDHVNREPVVDLPVFNIETADHTYGVPFTVHNCDVLEHIPTAMTMLVVDQLLRVTKRGLFLSVSLVPDGFGVWVGQPLHQTVQPFTWWRDHLRELGRVTEARDLLNAAVFYVEPRC